MGTSEALVGNLGGRYRKVIYTRKSPIFPLADLVAAAELLTLPFPPHWLFAHQAARAVEAFEAAPATEGVMSVFNWRWQLHSAVPAAVAGAKGAVLAVREGFFIWHVSGLSLVPSLRRFGAPVD
jgi:hypothetical protein